MNEDAQAKLGLKTLLERFVPLVVQREVQAPAQFADVFVSGPPKSPKLLVETLGTLGRMTCQPTLLEAFSDTVTLSEARDCQRKQLTLHHTLELEEKGAVAFPWLWVLSLGKPKTLLKAWRLTGSKSWPRGVYRSATGAAVGVVVLRELPHVPETATLRLFGDSRLRRELDDELFSVADDHPVKQVVKEVLRRWRIWLAGNPEDEEIRRRVMDFARFDQLVAEEDHRIAEEKRISAEEKRISAEEKRVSAEEKQRFAEEAQRRVERGAREGELRGELKALQRVLARRGLALTAEQQAQVAACTDPETLERWLDQAVTAASADEALR